MDNLLVQLNLINWDIIGVSEAKIKEVLLIPVTGNDMLYNSGVDASSKRSHGVGFLVHRDHKNRVIEF